MIVSEMVSKLSHMPAMAEVMIGEGDDAKAVAYVRQIGSDKVQLSPAAEQAKKTAKKVLKKREAVKLPVESKS